MDETWAADNTLETFENTSTGLNSDASGRGADAFSIQAQMCALGL